MFSSNKMISLSELFDLLTLSVVYDVSNYFLKTFTSARNDFLIVLNVRKSSKKLSSDLLESLSIAFFLSVTSFSFIISPWYSSFSLLPVPAISLFKWDSFLQVHLVSHIIFLLTCIKDFRKSLLKFLSQVNC